MAAAGFLRRPGQGCIALEEQSKHNELQFQRLTWPDAHDRLGPGVQCSISQRNTFNFDSVYGGTLKSQGSIHVPFSMTAL